MAYRIRFTAPAEADAYAAYEYIRQSAPESAEKWLRGLFLFTDTLDEMPTRCPLIAEAEVLGHSARQLSMQKILPGTTLAAPVPLHKELAKGALSKIAVGQRHNAYGAVMPRSKPAGAGIRGRAL